MALPATAYALAMQPLAVPNTLVNPGDRDYGKTFEVTAAAVNATLGPGQADFYAVQATAGEVMTFQVISNNMTLNPLPFDPELIVTDGFRQPRGVSGQHEHFPPGSPFFSGAYNLHEFESNDSTLYDVTFSTAGTYYVGVDASPLTPRATGIYQLDMYSFATSTIPPSPSLDGLFGDTIVGGAGKDTVVGLSGNDYINFPNGLSGQATIYAASGHDVADQRYRRPNSSRPMAMC